MQGVLKKSFKKATTNIFLMKCLAKSLCMGKQKVVFRATYSLGPYQSINQSIIILVILYFTSDEHVCCIISRFWPEKKNSTMHVPVILYILLCLRFLISHLVVLLPFRYCRQLLKCLINDSLCNTETVFVADKR